MPALPSRPEAPVARRAPALATALDGILAAPDLRTAQGRPVQAPVDAVAAAMRATPLGEARLAHVLLVLRSLGGARDDGERTLGSLAADPPPGLVVLADAPRELAFGWTGRPWFGADAVHDAPRDAAAFAAGAPADAVRVAVSVRCDEAAYGTLLVTETRIAIGLAADRPFRRYWSLVRVGSGLVRTSMLRAIARRATAA